MKVRASLFKFFIIIFLLPCNLFAQGILLESSSENEEITSKSTEPLGISFFADAGNLVMPINDIYVNGLTTKLGVTSRRFTSGLAFDLISSNKAFFSDNFDLVSPSYKYVFFGWDNEYICNPENRINFSLNIRTGFGFAEYSEKGASSQISYYEINDSTSYYTPVYSYYPGIVASNSFLSLEPGINVLYNVKKWLSIGAGWSSRIVIGMNEENEFEDDGFYSARFFLRFRMPEKRK